MHHPTEESKDSHDERCFETAVFPHHCGTTAATVQSSIQQVLRLCLDPCRTRYWQASNGLAKRCCSSTQLFAQLAVNPILHCVHCAQDPAHTGAPCCCAAAAPVAAAVWLLPLSALPAALLRLLLPERDCTWERQEGMGRVRACADGIRS